MVDPEQTYLTPMQAVEYLRERYGDAAAPRVTYLEKLRTVGGGPKFVRISRRIAYTPPWLDAWVIARTSRPMSSTSEAA